VNFRAKLVNVFDTGVASPLFPGEIEMSDQTEWEVVDAAEPRAQPQPDVDRSTMMRAMLGRWWRWKVGAALLAACLVLALVAALAGVLFVVGMGVVLVSLVVAKVRQLLRQHSRSLTS
jgi:hypothetical protein